LSQSISCSVSQHRTTRSVAAHMRGYTELRTAHLIPVAGRHDNRDGSRQKGRHGNLFITELERQKLNVVLPTCSLTTYHSV
ncbi:hypothetical protein KUCAC02_021543, partial [Chaenocephalus aceratus]